MWNLTNIKILQLNIWGQYFLNTLTFIQQGDIIFDQIKSENKDILVFKMYIRVQSF